MNVVALRLGFISGERWSSPVTPNVPIPQPEKLQSARYTIFPPTIVATTFPVNAHPSNGVL